MAFHVVRWDRPGPASCIGILGFCVYAVCPLYAAAVVVPSGNGRLTDALAVDDGCASAAGGSDAACALSAVQLLRVGAGPGGRPATANGTKPAAPSGVTFFTVENRAHQAVNELNGLAGRAGVRVLSPFEGREWRGFRTKVDLQLEFVGNMSRRLGPEASARELVVFMDGGDVFWGGCELETFLASYREIVSRQRAPVVFNAEVTPPQVCLASMDACSEPDAPFRDTYTRYTAGCGKRCDGAWLDACGDAAREPTCAGAWQPGLRFLNSGFFMGPVDKVLDMLRWVEDRFDEYMYEDTLAAEGGRGGGFGDQDVFRHYWLQHQDAVTLDYRGELCLALYQLHSGVMIVDAQAGTLWNAPLGRAQCFVHGNGGGRYPMLTYLYQLLGPDDLRQLPFLFTSMGSAWSEIAPVLAWSSAALASPADGDANLNYVPPGYPGAAPENTALRNTTLSWLHHFRLAFWERCGEASSCRELTRREGSAPAWDASLRPR